VWIVDAVAREVLPGVRRVAGMTGREWVVDAYGCRPDALRDPQAVEKLFDQLIGTLALKPVRAPEWHRFPDPGGVTGVVLLEESHIACHTFPEYGSMCLNVFCCSPKPEFIYVFYLARHFGAESVRVRRIDRTYGSLPPAA
jgi:S-adenosylmethionine decarboxylase